MKVNIGLTDKARDGVVRTLNTLLADEFVLYAKTRGFHWNVTGPHFSELHKLFETQYDELAETIDEVAERTRALGGIATGSLKRFLSDARITDSTAAKRSATQMVGDLLKDHESVIRSLRKDIEAVAAVGDEGTTDFLTGLMERHEKTAWMLRAHLED